MTRFVALLRAINTPPRHVKMDRLRSIFESLHFDNVETFIASGNVIFDAAAEPDHLVPVIEAALEAELGFDVKTFLRTASEVVAVADLRPFPGELDVEVSFLEVEPDPQSAQALEATATGSDRLTVIGRELYWGHTGPRSDSNHSEARVVRMLGIATTQRSIRTVERIADTFLR